MNNGGASKLAALLVVVSPLAAAVQVENRFGRIDVRAAPGVANIEYKASSPARAPRSEDVRLTSSPQSVTISTSASVTRPLMKQAAEDFVAIAQPQDRVAVHVLSNSLFRVVSPLTADRKRLPVLVDRIPEVAGGSPIYDSIVLSPTLVKRSTARVSARRWNR